jgi:hypothetical protein
VTVPAKAIPDLIPPSNVEAVITRVLTVAASQIGYREGRDSSGWNNDTAYGAWYPMNYNPWCEMFVDWSAWKAGIPETVIPKYAYTPYGLKWFRDRSQEVATPRRGDLFFLVNSSGLAHHIGFVEKATGGAFQTVEGNTNTNGSDQGDGVYRLTRTTSSRLKLVRPNYAACVVKSDTPAPAPKDTTIGAWCINRLARDHYGVSGQCLVDNQQVFNIAVYLQPQLAESRKKFWAACAVGAWVDAGNLVVEAIKTIQKTAGLTQDGVFGPKTAAFLRTRGYTIN